MFSSINFSNYNLLLKALDRISRSEQSNEEVYNDLRDEDYMQNSFSILRYIEDPS